MDKRKFLIQLKITVGNNTKHIQIKKNHGLMVGIFDWDAIKQEGSCTEMLENEFDEDDDE